MAAAIIPVVAPLIAQFLPDVISLIASLVHPKAAAAESLGSGTGAVKFADVFVSVMSDLTNAKIAGTIAAIPDDATVKTVIQSVVTSMQLSGLLGGTAASPVSAPAAPAAQSQSVVLKAGQSLLVTA